MGVTILEEKLTINLKINIYLEGYFYMKLLGKSEFNNIDLILIKNSM